MSERIPPRSTGADGSSGASRPVDAPTNPRVPITERIRASLPGGTAEPDDKATASTHATSRRARAAPRKAPRRARLRLTRIDPWTVMKTSFLLSVAFGIVTVVAVFMVWSVLGAAGVWDSINSTVAGVVEGDSGSSDFDITNYLGTGRVLGFTMLVAVIDVILLTAIATLTAFLYNMAAALLGGIEVTLAEDQH